MTTNIALNDTLHRLIHIYKKQLVQNIRAEGIALPITHIRTLKSIRAYPLSTGKSIASSLNRDKAQVARVLNDLIATGFIEKQPNPDDKRSQLLALTLTGNQLLDEIQRIEQRVGIQLTRGIDPLALEQFMQTSARIIKNGAEESDHNQCGD
ncbi:MarR family winged helix-turn-helix transcriptional regulator [Gilvimarinus sp. 1_MG-2023]|uniref:MarR family winged helix-turn-helix transcriptional regulator n=1 Tax=Gilvimarinus sp. 1_MG-2023 TaxID=3062638 RepID=UPI0026E272E9|nr:MarR family winged helix-turn-helix transcriptional regulator [Gilvimarinus sp. 1_MG-2023]MDO6746156.1 MarR family winged helix-turn-helix transcriptional regulator [Gilvimarinus sp. 1_MG-2023]